MAKQKYTPKVQKDESSKTNINLISAIVIFVISFFFWQFWRNSNSNSEKHLEEIKYTAIPKIDWSPEKPFASEAAFNRTPIVLRNTVIEKWTARKKWNPKYISSTLQRIPLKKVHQHSSPIIVFYEEGAPNSNISNKWRKSDKRVQSMNVKEFFDKIADPNDKMFYYWNDEIPKQLLSDIQERDVSPNGRPSYIGVWMGKKELFLSEFHLISRETIWPPEKHLEFYLSPRLSPNYRQVQPNFETPNFSLHPKFNFEDGMQIILDEGDVLYLPPYWFHRVESLGPSDVIISLNAWTDSADHHAMDNIYNDFILVPFQTGDLSQMFSGVSEKFSDSIQSAIATKLFMEDSSLRISGKKNFIREIYESRYLPIFDRAPNLEHCPPEISDEVKENLRKKMEGFSQELFEAFETIQSQGVKEINLANYFEDLSAWAVGLENVNFFLQCF